VSLFCRRLLPRRRKLATATCAIVWDERFRSYDFGPGHPFNERPRALAARLLQLTALAEEPDRFTSLSDVPPASTPELARFHTAEFLGEVERLGRRHQAVALDSGDTPSFFGCYEASARIAGGALAALASVTGDGPRRAFHPAGGLHHAHPDHASGFCILNDVAVAIAAAVADGGPCKRVAYIDIDAHHGDGVMYGFYENGRVLDIDFHQDGRTLFPGTGAIEETGRKDGAGLKVNVPLPPGAGDGTFQPVFRRVVPTLLRSYRPELIVMQHGVDGHRGDRLTRLDYTRASFAMALRLTQRMADELCSGRLIVAGGGGYTPPTVSRVLAQAGFLLAGMGLPKDDAPVPETWQSEYEEELGEPAPPVWGVPGASTEAPAPTHDSERLVHALGGRLGMDFPME
jgi:acetoin utilization protein AcuC